MVPTSGQETSVSDPYSSATPPPRQILGYNRRRSVGVISPAYGLEKVSYSLRPSGYDYYKVVRVPFSRLELNGSFVSQTPIVWDGPVELVHAFNEIPIGMRPYVVSFEIELPRYLGNPKPWQLKFGFDQLASSRCRRLLAMSEIGAQLFAENAKKMGYPGLVEKLVVFRGSIKVTPRDDRSPIARDESRPLKLLFVGRDGFRKGLIPTIDALEELVALGVDIEATIICRCSDDADYTNRGMNTDFASVRQRIEGQRKFTYLPYATNAVVHDLMRSHDALLFPTLDESLGWVAVEAALAGLPVITTNIFALPELVVDGETGFVLPINRRADHRWLGLNLSGPAFVAEAEATFSSLRQGIIDRVMRLARDRSLIGSMGRAGRKRMERLYGRAQAAETLGGIYRDAVAGPKG